jgi:hypothetical protein
LQVEADGQGRSVVLWMGCSALSNESSSADWKVVPPSRPENERAHRLDDRLRLAHGDDVT